MWSRISNALKSKQDDEEDDWDKSGSPPVLNGVYEQHPNLSIFHNDEEEEPISGDILPASPSNGIREMLKRVSKSPWNEDARNDSTLSLPANLKNNLILNGSDSPPPPQDVTTRESHASPRVPETPIENRYGSIRPILRDRNAPGTGQSVRFFSRDSYKVITPDTSTLSEIDRTSVYNLLQQASEDGAAGSTPQHAVAFSPNDVSSLPKPFPATPGECSKRLASFAIPTSDHSNIFDVSQGVDFPTMSMVTETRLRDSAVEIEDSPEAIHADLVQRSSTPFKQNETGSFVSANSGPSMNRSNSLSFAQSVFHSAQEGPSADSEKSQSFKTAEEKSERPTCTPDMGPFKRSRATSDDLLQPMRDSGTNSPEGEVDHRAEALVVYKQPEPDSFSTNVEAFYSAQLGIPCTAPPSTPARKSSREEDLILSLKTQLALQQEMCSHYEIDLKARDELVEVLTTRLSQADKDAEKRKKALSQWKKKVLELEKACRHLEEEVEHSREESFERSVMDEASGEALRQLHRQINRLEMEKAETEKREMNAKDEIAVLKQEAAVKDSRIQRLSDDLAAKEQGETIHPQIRSPTHEDGSGEERSQLIARIDELEAEIAQVKKERLEAARKDEQLVLLQNELEAQWQNTEEMNDKIHALTREKEALQVGVEALEERISGMEMDWSQTENRKMELENEVQEAWNARDEMESEKQHVRSEVVSVIVFHTNIARSSRRNFMLSVSMLMNLLEHYRSVRTACKIWRGSVNMLSILSSALRIIFKSAIAIPKRLSSAWPFARRRLSIYRMKFPTSSVNAAALSMNRRGPLMTSRYARSKPGQRWRKWCRRRPRPRQLSRP
ncbi:hypothetical protein OE88DRAFT_574485 [Heliocybe sulcata]|uniref:Uncharacterized protein n=1 Tax=Heliocybe sulcata TaxID=5364 RepID=A0A5C3N3G0_9AGAM|nr:hypothetical protein OE88DRAFT_574485 [Heliocybe sulcata]